MSKLVLVEGGYLELTEIDGDLKLVAVDPWTKRISVYQANRLLDREFANGAWFEPRSTDPGEDGSGGVIPGMVRTFVPAANFSVASNKEKTNAEPIHFNNVPACDIRFMALFTAEEDGNFMRSCPLTTELIGVPDGASVTIPEGGSIFSLQDVES